MGRDSHFGMQGYGYFGKVALFLSDLMCTSMDICYKVADNRKEMFICKTKTDKEDGLEDIPEIKGFKFFAEIRGGLKRLM